MHNHYPGEAMSAFKDPFNPDVKLGCGCGRHGDQAAHDADLAAGSATAS